MSGRPRAVLLSGLVVLALVGLVVVSQRGQSTGTPLDVGARLVPDVVYAVPGESIDEAHRLDVYLPPDSSRPASDVPAVIWIHGGGWTGGDKSESMGPWDWTEMGIAVVAINYRLAEESTIAEAVTDVTAAVDHVIENGGEWGIDPERVALYGHSAGGHLAVLVAASEAPVVGVVAAGAPLDLVRLLDPDVSTFVGLEGDDAVAFVASTLGCVRVDEACREQAHQLSPALLPADSTPVLVIHGDEDRFVAVDQARAHADAHGSNPQVTVRVVPGLDHVKFRAEAEDYLVPLLRS